MARNVRPSMRAIAALASALLAACATGPAPEREDVFVVTRLVAPPEVSFDEVRMVDVDTDRNSFVSGSFNGEPVVIRLKVGRYRFKSIRARIPERDELPRFEQPERALELLPGSINYIGDIVIGRRREGYPLFIHVRPETVIEAAAMSPETFRGKTVVLVLGDQSPKRLKFESADGETLPGLTD